MMSKLFFGKNSKAEQASSNDLHLDYELNLEHAKKFIAKVTKYLLPFLTISIRGSHHYQNILVCIAFQAPTESALPIYAVNVCMSQPYNQFMKELNGYFNTLYQMAKKALDKCQVNI